MMNVFLLLPHLWDIIDLRRFIAFLHFILTFFMCVFYETVLSKCIPKNLTLLTRSIVLLCSFRLDVTVEWSFRLVKIIAFVFWGLIIKPHLSHHFVILSRCCCSLICMYLMLDPLFQMQLSSAYDDVLIFSLVGKSFIMSTNRRGDSLRGAIF